MATDGGTIVVRVRDGGESRDATVRVSSARAVRIGRDERCELRLTDGSVSRMHAVVELRTREWKVIDLGSGTKLNGTSINSAELRVGDVIEVGDVRIEILSLATGPVEIHGASPVPAAPKPPLRDTANAAHSPAGFGARVRAFALRAVARAVRAALIIEAEDRDAGRGR